MVVSRLISVQSQLSLSPVLPLSVITWLHLVSFSYLLSLARMSGTVLKNNGEKAYLSCSWFSCEWLLLIFIYNYIFIFSLLFTEFIYRYAIHSGVWYLQRIACGSWFSFSARWDPETWTQAGSLSWAISLSLPLLHCNPILSIVFSLALWKIYIFFSNGRTKKYFPNSTLTYFFGYSLSL